MDAAASIHPSLTDRLCVARVSFMCPEKRKLSNRDQPLWERILQGPSDDIMKIFMMDMDEREVSNDVRGARPVRCQ